MILESNNKVIHSLDLLDLVRKNPNLRIFLESYLQKYKGCDQTYEDFLIEHIYNSAYEVHEQLRYHFLWHILATSKFVYDHEHNSKNKPPSSPYEQRQSFEHV